MLERFKNYFGKLERLSDGELDRSAETLVCAEKQNVAKVIAHIAEMSRRKVALELGYKSTFHYCVERLHLSEGSVASRIHVVQCFDSFPSAPRRTGREPYQSHGCGTSMSAAEPHPHGFSLRDSAMASPYARAEGSLTPVLSENNVDTLLAYCAGMTKNAVLAEVMGVENAQKHIAEILEQALDVAFDKKDPKRKLERRKARQKATKTAPRPDEMSGDVVPGVKDEPARSRYIPPKVIERVHARGNHQCEYKSADGRRCRSRTGLEVEHERPFAIFRSHDERFLRLLCPAHNRLAAEHVYGAEFIQRKIDKRRKIDESRGRQAVPASRSPLPRAP